MRCRRGGRGHRVQSRRPSARRGDAHGPCAAAGGGGPARRRGAPGGEEATVTALAGPGGLRCEVYVDGGIRTGEDVLAALALGADAVFIGRPVLWALAAGGADGVHRLLAALTDDLACAMAQAGAPGVTSITGIAAPEC
ncbi:MAG: alpha-hydroxy-acid oxidizing protein [Streptosporangiaceae bacterium]